MICSSLPPACLSQRHALYEAGTIVLQICQNGILAGCKHSNDNALVLMSIKTIKLLINVHLNFNFWYPFALCLVCLYLKQILFICLHYNLQFSISLHCNIKCHMNFFSFFLQRFLIFKVYKCTSNPSLYLESLQSDSSRLLSLGHFFVAFPLEVFLDITIQVEKSESGRNNIYHGGGTK